MTMKNAGKSVAEIRKAIDAKYSQMGPPTPTPMPPAKTSAAPRAVPRSVSPSTPAVPR
jgi:hypothetical protein